MRSSIENATISRRPSINKRPKTYITFQILRIVKIRGKLYRQVSKQGSDNRVELQVTKSCKTNVKHSQGVANTRGFCVQNRHQRLVTASLLDRYCSHLAILNQTHRKFLTSSNGSHTRDDAHRDMHSSGCAPCAGTLPRPVKQSFITAELNISHDSLIYIFSAWNHMWAHISTESTDQVAADIRSWHVSWLPPRPGVKGKSPAVQSPGQTVLKLLPMCLCVYAGRGYWSDENALQKKSHVFFTASLGTVHHTNMKGMKIKVIKSNLNPRLAGWHTLMLLSLLSR